MIIVLAAGILVEFGLVSFLDSDRLLVSLGLVHERTALLHIS